MEDVEFSISFASCFYNDIVGLKVNCNTLINPQKVTSDRVLGITYLGAYQNNKALWVGEKDNKKQFPKLLIGKKVTLNIMLNGKWRLFNVDLEKGKIVFIENCSNGAIQELSIKQFKEPVLLD
jgi:hypothetical protein